MEIYRGTVPTATFQLPTENSSVTEVTYSVNDSDPVVLGGVTTDDTTKVASVALPYQPNEATVEVVWTFSVGGSGSFSETETYNVVTRLLSADAIRRIVEDATEDEVEEIEKGVRHIINSHCGQSFGRYVGKFSVIGAGDGNLRLPRRLISITSLNDNAYWNDFLAIRGGGWFLQSRHMFAPSVRADFDGWHYSNQVPIIAPATKARSTFIKNQEYVVDGVWGWNEIPDQVVEAAKLLVNDYACGDSLYRDRFITSVTAADWRLQFHDGAFANTGNVRANQLLSEYVLRRGWVVI